VQLGRINKNNLIKEDEAALAKIVAAPPSHLYILPTYLKDERIFNEILSLADVVFAVYRDFGRSSNMLSKAAYFEKPILVATGSLMGTLVERYKIGLTVDQNDTLAMHQALQDAASIEELETNFKAYRHDFSDTIMQQRLSDFIHQNIAH
jgi:glycosyltransferase involved in cell wall biosynthesis